MTPFVTYRGPHGALEIDGLRLERDGEPVRLTVAQLKRLRDRPNTELDVTDESAPARPATRTPRGARAAQPEPTPLAAPEPSMSEEGSNA